MADSPAAVPAPATVVPAAAPAPAVKKPTVTSLFDTPLYDPAKVERNDKIESAESRIKINPWDTDAWTQLVNETKNLNIDSTRCYFEKFLRQFPTSARFWKMYLLIEIQAGNLQLVDKAFKLLFNNEILSVELYRCYIQYMKDKRLPRDTMQKAYDYVLGAIGMDLESAPIWQDYLDFLKSWETTNTFEEGQKMSALRKVYQEVVGQAVDGVEQFWKEFDQYENGLNKVLAKKLLNDRASSYQAARAALRERKVRSEGLARYALATPFRCTARERQQLDMWRSCIEFEKSNPLRLDKKEDAEKRVIFAYRQALMVFWHSQQLWFELCSYVANSGGNAVVEYEKALNAQPNSMLVGFAYADYEEARKNYSKAVAIYERLLECPATTDATLVYVQYMKFKRRVEGLTEARKIFKRARSDKDRVNHQVFVSSALMEYHADKKVEVAEKIFRFGLDNQKLSFASNLNYVTEYLDFLSHLTEDNNTRVLFERVLSVLAKEDQAPVWERFLRFEADYGDLQSAIGVEQRFRDAHTQSGAPVCFAVQRYRCMDLVPCSSAELEFMGFARAFPCMTGASQQTVSAQQSATTEFPVVNAGSVVPDLSQMVPFNPEEGMAGGGNAPGVIKDLLKQLPPSSTFAGPYVNVMALLEWLDSTDKLPSLEPLVDESTVDGVAGHRGKRPRPGRASESEDENEEATVSTTSQGTGTRPNLFQKRMRQQLQPQ